MDIQRDITPYTRDNDDIKTPFVGLDDIKKFYSQAAQDLFVLGVLDGKKNGFFLDIGCHEPIEISNTYLLESAFGWTGIAIDINALLVDTCRRIRAKQTKFYCGDAVTFDYALALTNAPKIIDYISLDVDGIETLNTLKNLPLNTYRFRVMTFEHDSYSRGPLVREKSREYLNSLGYKRVCSDVKNDGNAYEDWYVAPDLVDMQRIIAFESDAKEWKDLIWN